MKTVKEILTENRESVISSIKYVFKTYSGESLKTKMSEFLFYAEANADIKALETSKRVKTDLKVLVQKMSIAQTRSNNVRLYGKANPGLRDIMGKIADRYEEQGKVWNPIAKDWVYSR